MNAIRKYEEFLFTTKDNRYAGLQSALRLRDREAIPDSMIRTPKLDNINLFKFLFQLRLIDRVLGPKFVEASTEEPKMSTHVRVAKPATSCKVCIVF